MGGFCQNTQTVQFLFLIAWVFFTNISKKHKFACLKLPLCRLLIREMLFKMSSVGMKYEWAHVLWIFWVFHISFPTFGGSLSKFHWRDSSAASWLDDEGWAVLLQRSICAEKFDQLILMRPAGKMSSLVGGETTEEEMHLLKLSYWPQKSLTENASWKSCLQSPSALKLSYRSAKYNLG